MRYRAKNISVSQELFGLFGSKKKTPAKPVELTLQESLNIIKGYEPDVNNPVTIKLSNFGIRDKSARTDKFGALLMDEIRIYNDNFKKARDAAAYCSKEFDRLISKDFDDESVVDDLEDYLEQDELFLAFSSSFVIRYGGFLSKYPDYFPRKKLRVIEKSKYDKYPTYEFTLDGKIFPGLTFTLDSRYDGGNGWDYSLVEHHADVEFILDKKMKESLISLFDIYTLMSFIGEDSVSEEVREHGMKKTTANAFYIPIYTVLDDIEDMLIEIAKQLQ